jgi:hypothetical protein
MGCVRNRFVANERGRPRGGLLINQSKRYWFTPVVASAGVLADAVACAGLLMK